MRNDQKIKAPDFGVTFLTRETAAKILKHNSTTIRKIYYILNGKLYPLDIGHKLLGMENLKDRGDLIIKILAATIVR